MSKAQMLRGLVNQRLTAAAQEICGLFEGTIAEYEEELCSLKEENERHRKLLHAVFNPEVRLQRADVQLLLVVKEEVPSEQQVWSFSLDQVHPESLLVKEEQEDPEPPHIKEEQVDPEPPHIKEDQEDPRYRMPKYQGYTFIAHNASGFDNCILLEYFVKQGITPGVTMRGSRVVLMYDQTYQQRWIDSFSFLPMRLSKHPRPWALRI
ncbi:uncharacterized protein LOC130191299 [Pseudoliparis swirei]|uniref:uncharacterized protein LOC130191299 n=1 Tax=Pseudoliparis swirei TaxID=2059687 RepID=UPI0024BEABC2|nr:uncharacterized protein LOC130191299 [Pseudoliparis swirei]